MSRRLLLLLFQSIQYLAFGLPSTCRPTRAAGLLAAVPAHWLPALCAQARVLTRWMCSRSFRATSVRPVPAAKSRHRHGNHCTCIRGTCTCNHGGGHHLCVGRLETCSSTAVLASTLNLSVTASCATNPKLEPCTCRSVGRARPSEW